MPHFISVIRQDLQAGIASNLACALLGYIRDVLCPCGTLALGMLGHVKCVATTVLSDSDADHDDLTHPRRFRIITTQELCITQANCQALENTDDSAFQTLGMAIQLLLRLTWYTTEGICSLPHW